MGVCGAEPYPVTNPFHETASNRPIAVRVLVLNYDPIVVNEGSRRLSDLFHWNEPETLAFRYVSAMEAACGGAIRYEIAEWRNLNEIYAQSDGYRPTVDEYVRNRRAGGGWHDGHGADYPRLLREQGVADMISRGLVDEVWIFSDHFFGLWEASMAGPGAFNINGGVYPEVPSSRPFAFYGFNYERGVAEMMHDAAHRVEATLNRVYGGWKLEHPVSNWDKFSANAAQSGGVAGVGTCHYPANAEHDYDYGNPREVQSWADAFLSYPKVDWKTKPVSCVTWSHGPDYQLDYMRWYFTHIPRADGVNDDGRQNTWFKYIWDFEDYDRKGQPLPPRACLIGHPIAVVGESATQIAVSFSSVNGIDRRSLAGLALEIVTPDGERVPAQLLGANGSTFARPAVAFFQAAPAGHSWKATQIGSAHLFLRGHAIKDLYGAAFAAGEIGSFRIVARGAPAIALPADASTSLLWHGDNAGTVAKGKPAIQADKLGSVAGVAGKAALLTENSRLRFPLAGNLAPERGTIELWFKPDFAMDDRKGRVLLEAGKSFDNGLRLVRDGAGNLRVLMWGDDPATPAIERTVERGAGVSGAKLPPGKWTHIALTWDGASQALWLYINGRLLESHRDGVRLTAWGSDDFSIGADRGGESPAPGAVNELRISSRARTSTEIAPDYECASPPKPLLPGDASLTLASGELHRLSVSEGAEERTYDAAWTTSDSGIVSIPSAGRALGQKPGHAVISATYAGRSAQIPVAVKADTPTARLISVELPKEPHAPLLAVVQFNSPAGIDPANVRFGDILLLSQNGIFGFGEPAGAPQPDGAGMRAAYSIPAPATGWPSGGAAFGLQLKAWRVHDAKGVFFPETYLSRIALHPFNAPKTGANPLE